jgi:hypothetical protein
MWTGSVENKPSRTCSYPLQWGTECQVEIVGMSCTTRIESLLFASRIPDPAADEYRFAVVTLRITKPAGASLTLAAADLTRHYYHGQDMEVAPCEGLSGFKSDAVFGYVEPDTIECWICLGHPAFTEPLVCPSPAWKGDGKAQAPTLGPSIGA